MPITLLVSIGLLGATYSRRVWRRMIQGGIAASMDLEDRVWYSLVPAIAYLMLATADAALAIETRAACALLAFGVCLLMLAGIRNAWDMTTWIAMRRQD